MTKFKKNNYKFWHSPFALIILFFILIFFGYKIIDLTKKEIKTSHEKELILDKIDELRTKQVSLNEDISKLKTDEGQEEIIRDKYPFGKDKEKMVTIVEKEAVSPLAPQESKVSHGFWNWVKRIFSK